MNIYKNLESYAKLRARETGVLHRQRIHKRFIISYRGNINTLDFIDELNRFASKMGDLSSSVIKKLQKFIELFNTFAYLQLIFVQIVFGCL